MASSVAGVKGLYEKRGWFYYQPPTPKDGPGKGGRPKAVALKTQDLATALERMENAQSEATLERVNMDGTLAEVLPTYYAAKASDAKSTRRCRQMALDAFQEACRNPRLTSINARMIEQWRQGLAAHGGRGGKPVSPTTIKDYTIILRAFLNWAVKEKMLRSNPMAGMVREVRVMTTRVQGFLTEEERESLLSAEAPDYVRLILMLGFFAGLRDGEMLAANPKWLWIAEDGLRGTLTVQATPIEYTDGRTGLWTPKRHKRRTIPLHPRLLEFLQGYGMRSPWLLAPEKDKWPEEKKNSKRFDAKKALAGVAKRAGVRKLTPHMLRHSFATHLAMKGVALAEIAGLIGDSLRVTEEHYAGYLNVTFDDTEYQWKNGASSSGIGHPNP